MFRLFSLSFLLPLMTLVAVSTPLKIDSDLVTTLETSKGSANILIILGQNHVQQELTKIEQKVYTNRGERLTHVAQTLKEAALKSQADILTFLKNEKSGSAIVHPFWITNRLIVRGADLQLVQKLMTQADNLDIAEIREERIIPLTPVQYEPAYIEDFDGKAQWGVEKIRAPAVWALGYTGEGAVVANIDTGVRGTHEALVGNHRVNFGWYDPEGNTAIPTDSSGHGTHTMGLMVGQAKEIGVAPGAKWIACKGCGTSSCTEFALFSCAEWIACPNYNDVTDCTLAPHVVSNSWGGGQNDDWFNDPIAAWRAGGILPIFSLGSSGSNCGSANSPGDSALAFAAGATTATDNVSSFSGRGPTVGDHRVKPDVCAPGSNVYSSYNSGDSTYATMSGTSMAAPHVGGLVALLVGKNPNLSVDEVQWAIQNGTVSIMSPGDCGGIDDGPTNDCGYGRIDALNSIQFV